jgi:predicted metal-dependent HD superfamily phosphohydrolase
MFVATKQSVDRRARMTEAIVTKYWRLIEARHDARAFAVLEAAYGEPHRGYHAIGHIVDLLRQLDRFARLATRIDLVAAAIFWHDAVYVARGPGETVRPDVENVRDSAALFARCAAFEKADQDAVIEMILATSDHVEAKPARQHYPGFFGDFDLFLDLDLSSLAAPWPAFVVNLEKLRFEYAFVPEAVFLRGRLEMIERFARGGERLFRREETRALWSEAARANFARSAADLRARLGVL